MGEITIYDHKTIDFGNGKILPGRLLELLSGFSGIAKLGPQNECSAITILKDSIFIIGHFSNNKNWEDLLNVSPRGSTRIRVSTVGRHGFPNRVTSKGVYELNLQPSHSDLTRNDWQELITEIVKPGVAQDIAEGRIPANMARYFDSTTPIHLMALSILCQGFLAATTQVKQEMAGKYGIPPGIEQQVRSREWWLNVFIPQGSTRPTLCEAVLGEEWPDSRHSDHRDQVKKLIGQLVTDDNVPYRLDGAFDRLVIAAYEAICLRLSDKYLSG